MKLFSVLEISELANVSIRTLHHYDNIGLLKPYNRTDAGYRLYSNNEILKLHQILFFKELGFSLSEIDQVINNPDYDMIDGLLMQKSAILDRLKKLQKQLKVLDKTIVKLNNGETMLNTKELYDGFNNTELYKFRQEILKKYGNDAIEKSERSLMKMGKKKVDALLEDFKSCNDKLFRMLDESPFCNIVQAEIANHYNIIRMFWGTHNSDDKQAAAYSGLGELYVNDKRYIKINDMHRPDFAKFLAEAMKYYAENELS